MAARSSIGTARRPEDRNHPATFGETGFPKWSPQCGISAALASDRSVAFRDRSADAHIREIVFGAGELGDVLRTRASARR